MFNIKFFVVITVFLAGLLLSVAGVAARDIYGTVHDASTHAPLADVSVVIAETGDSTATDGSGVYFFSNVPDGYYTFMVGGHDYTPRIMTNVAVTASCCIGIAGNFDKDPDELIDIGDLTLLINYLFTPGTFAPCIPEGNVDGDAAGLVDIGDLTALISYLFLGGSAPEPCR